MRTVFSYWILGFVSLLSYLPQLRLSLQQFLESPDRCLVSDQSRNTCRQNRASRPTIKDVWVKVNGEIFRQSLDDGRNLGFVRSLAVVMFCKYQL